MKRLLKITIAVGLFIVFIGGVYAENPEIYCKHIIYGVSC